MVGAYAFEYCDVADEHGGIRSGWFSVFFSGPRGLISAFRAIVSTSLRVGSMPILMGLLFIRPNSLLVHA